MTNSCQIIRRKLNERPTVGLLAIAAAVLTLSTAAVWGVWAATAGAADRDGRPTYYVSIGDSYAAGYRPVGPGGSGPGSTSRDAFAYQVQDSLTARHGGWTIVNFACSGETAYSMTFDRGCSPDALAPAGVQYPYDPQSVAAANFIAAHHDQIGLITVAMGANDVTSCLGAADAAAGQRCAEVEVPRVVLSLDYLLSRIRASVGPSVPIVGVSYINVFLADRLSDDPAAQRRAEFSVPLFDNYLNPALQQTYSRYGASFVDATSLAGADLPSTDKSALPGRGTVTAAVGRVCALTYYCSKGDPHPNREGHALIAADVERLAGL